MQDVIKINTVHVGMIDTNCYIVYRLDDEDNNKAIIIDPGAEANKIIAAIDVLGVEPVGILLTHGHFDHILAVKELVSKYNVKVYASKDEEELLADARLNLSSEYRLNITLDDVVRLDDNQEIELAGINIKTIHTPGHTAGSMCYLIEENNTLFSGDMLFREFVGRTDFPTGSSVLIINSLNGRLMKLDDEVKVYPGHGEDTTIGYERANNMFVK